MTTTAGTGTQAIDRAASLLVRVVESDEGYTVGELATVTGLPKSTASRLLRALERHGLVGRDPDGGGLRPGRVLVDYAQRDSGTVDLIALAQPGLERIGSKCGETVNLAVPTADGNVEIIAQVDSIYLLGANNWVGRRGVVHASAFGKVFMAHGVVPQPARLDRVAPRTITDRAVLGAQLDAVRRRGFAVAFEELEPGLLAVAAPIRDRTGRVVASISISGPTVRLAASDLDRLGALVVGESRVLSARLGYRPPQEGAA